MSTLSQVWLVALTANLQQELIVKFAHAQKHCLVQRDRRMSLR